MQLLIMTDCLPGMETAAQKVGRPKIGGPFKLTTQNGTEFTEQDLLGKHSLVYVGVMLFLTHREG